MHDPELTPNQEAPLDQPMSAGQAAGLGAIMGVSVVYVPQFIDPIPPFTNISSIAAEAGVLSASVLAGALLMSAGRFIFQHVSQWRQQRAEAA